MLLARNNAQGIDRIDRGHESVARDDAADSRRWPDGEGGGIIRYCSSGFRYRYKDWLKFSPDLRNNLTRGKK